MPEIPAVIVVAVIAAIGPIALLVAQHLISTTPSRKIAEQLKVLSEDFAKYRIKQASLALKLRNWRILSANAADPYTIREWYQLKAELEDLSPLRDWDDEDLKSETARVQKIILMKEKMNLE